MIKQFDLSALGESSYYRPNRTHKIVTDKKFRNTPEPDDDGNEVNRYVLSRIICSMLNDYSEEPDFVKEDTNFTSLKGLDKEDWDDFKQAFVKRVSKNLGVTDLDLEKFTFAWTREDKREVKSFVDAVWNQISEEEPEDETSSKEDLDSVFKDLEDVDTESSKEDDEDDDKKSDDKSKSKKEDDDDAEDEDDDESSSKSKKKDDEDDDDKDDEEDVEDEEEDKKKSKSKDKEKDEDESEDEEDDESEDKDEDDKKSDKEDEEESKSKSKSKKDDEDEDDENTEDEDDDEESDSESKSKKKDKDEDTDEEEEDKSSKSKNEKSEEFLSELFGQTPADRLNRYKTKLDIIRQAIHGRDNGTGCIDYPLVSDKVWMYNPEDDTTLIKLPSPKITLDYLNKVCKAIDIIVKFIHTSQNNPDEITSMRRIFESIVALRISSMFKGEVSLSTSSSIKDTYLESRVKPVKWPNGDWYNCTRRYNVPAYVSDGYTTLDRALSMFGVYALMNDREHPMYNVIDALSVWYGKVVDNFIRIIRTLHENTPVVHINSPEADRLEQKIRATVVRNIREVEESQYPVTTWDSSAFTKDLRQLEMYRNYVRALNISASSEGLGTGLLKVFIGVTDTFLKVGNTFKTNVFKFYKSLKRSEMRYYFESHTTMCLKVEATPITSVSKLDVPIPSGMKGTYQNAVVSMEQTYESLDMLSFAQGTLASLIDLRRKLMRNEDYKTTMVPMENIMNQRATAIPQMRLALDKVFTSQKTPITTNFMNVYKSMKEFKDVRVSLLDMEKYLADVNKMVNLVDDTNTVLADITTYLSEDSEVDKTMVASMINIVKYLANSYDLYGVTTTRQMAVEHNHIGSIGQIWSNIR